MANVNLSLDEIIQKKFKFGSNKGRGRGKAQAAGAKRTAAARGRGGAVVNQTGAPARITQGTKAAPGSKVTKVGGGGAKLVTKRGDARLTIIAKKRLKLSDARDRLAEIAKQSGDAREKLTQLRRTKLVNQSVANTGKTSWPASGASHLDPLRTVRGGNITVRKGRNGRISLSTKRNVEMMWKPLAKSSWDWGKGSIAPYHDLDDPGENMSNVPSLGLREPLPGDYANAELVPSHSLLLRRTVNNDQMHASRPPPLPPLPPSVHSYRGAAAGLGPSSERGPMGLQALSMNHPWAKGNTSPRHYDLRGHPPRPPIVPSKRQGMSLLLSEREEWGGGGGEAPAVGSSYQGISTIALKRNSHPQGSGDHLPSGKGYMEDEAMRIEDEDEAEDDAEEEEYALMGINARKAGRISRELKARLDIPPAAASGQLAPFQRPANSQHQRAPAAVPNDATASQQRYKVRVSNLQPTVTQEDIRELFEDIGPLACPPRLLPPPSGEAIVCFRERSDAARAVDVYHLRQLDGQPMRCSLVSSTTSTTSTTSSSTNNSNNVKSSGGSTNPLHATSSRPSMPTSSSTLKLPSGGKTPVMPDIATIHKALFNKA
ncbi:uncharacterized protein [Hetaerina americana]|uniref:uncharacterized protein n=1 Tax=Hetaerina americana TaxID=62018 RepID=UPI003A7F5482